MSTNPANLQQSKGLSELWRRLRFVFLAIIIYRIGTHIPIPGIDPERLATLFEQNQGTLLDLFNMFSGGALERMSIMALNIMPYITASIIMSLLEGTTPSLKKRFREEGEEGRRNEYHAGIVCIIELFYRRKLRLLKELAGTTSSKRIRTLRSSLGDAI